MPHNDSQYFRELHQWPDTAIMPDEEILSGDTPEEIKTKKATKLSKLQIRLTRISQVYEQTKLPGFKVMENSLMYRAKHIERFSIWEALRKNDKAVIQSLWAEHEGIIMFFHKYNDITNVMVALKEQIEDLANMNTLTAAEEVAKHIN